jgi:serine protease
VPPSRPRILAVMRRTAIVFAMLLAAAVWVAAPRARASSGGSRVARQAAPAKTAAPANASAAAAQSKSAETGNLLVLLDQNQTGPRAAIARATAAELNPYVAGPSVPEIGLVTLRPPPGTSLQAFAAAIRGLPGIASVEPEHRYVPRLVPNDPALTALDPSNGIPWQWYLTREDFYPAWSITRGARTAVAVIDTGIDGTHPDLKPKIAAAIDQQARSDDSGPAETDQVGHGTDVASLACADTNNGIGLASAGYDCRLVIEKTDFSDSSIAASIVDATNRHVDAINMSFGPSVPTSAPAPASEVRALRYAASHKVVLVAAAADSPGTEQGDPGNVLQPKGTGHDITRGLGLDVTAAQYNGTRAPFAGSGSEISLAAYGAFEPDNESSAFPCSGPGAGIFGAYPANSTSLEQPPPSACRVDFRGDDRYATIAGTSMSAPQVAAVGAMMRVLNPYATLSDILRTIKRTARRPRHTNWTANLGWGILDADAAIEAIRRVDRLRPLSRLHAPPVARRRSFLLSWTSHDQQRPGLIASGVASFRLYMSVDGGPRKLIARTTRHRFTFTGLPGNRYTFFLFAVDHAGNQQLHAARASTFVARSAPVVTG